MKIKLKNIIVLFIFGVFSSFMFVVPAHAENVIVELKSKYKFEATTIYARRGYNGVSIGEVYSSGQDFNEAAEIIKSSENNKDVSSFSATHTLSTAYVFNKNCNESNNGCWALRDVWNPESNSIWSQTDIYVAMKSDDSQTDFISLYQLKGSTAVQQAVETVWKSRSPIDGHAIWVDGVYYGSPVKYEDLKNLQSTPEFYACFYGTFNGGTMFVYGDGTSEVDAQRMCEANYNNSSQGQQFSIVYHVTLEEESAVEMDSTKNIGVTCKWSSAVSDGEINGNTSIDTMSREAAFVFNSSTGKGAVAGNNISSITASFAVSGLRLREWSQLPVGTSVDSFHIIEHRPADTIKVIGYIVDAVIIVAGIVAIVATVGTATPGVVGVFTAVKAVGGTLISTAVRTVAVTLVTEVSAYAFNYVNGPEVEMCVGFDSCKDSEIKCTIGEFSKNPSSKPHEVVDCDILNTDFGKILKFIMKLIRGVGCAILVLFSVIDFVKPIISSDADSLKKNSSVFIKRLIIFVLLLFVPALVQLALSLIEVDSCTNI